MQSCNITYSNGLASYQKSDINCLYFNARSLKKNFQIIEDFISQSELSYHLIVVTETWLFSNETHFYNFPNYNAFHSTRDCSRGGGVAIYVHNNYDNANEIGNKSFNGNNCLAIELLKEKKNICVVYRQPNSSTDPSGTTEFFKHGFYRKPFIYDQHFLLSLSKIKSFQSNPYLTFPFP